MSRRQRRIRSVLGLGIAVVAIVRVVLIMAILYLRFWFRLKIWRHASVWRFKSNLKGLPRSLALELEEEYGRVVSYLTSTLVSGIAKGVFEKRIYARREGVYG